MKAITYYIPENLSDCDSINCDHCYLARAQTIFSWEPSGRDCFFRIEFIDHEYLAGRYSEGKSMSIIEQKEYQRKYPPNRIWLEIIRNDLKKRRLLEDKK